MNTEDLAEAEDRLALLQGLVAALAEPEELLRVVAGGSTKEEAVESLVVRFSLARAHAAAILDLKVSRWVPSEGDVFRQEIRELETLISSAAK